MIGSNRDPRPRTALQADGRLDENTELRFETIFRDLETITGSAEDVKRHLQTQEQVRRQDNRSLIARVEALETEIAALQKRLDEQDARLKALEAPPPTTPEGTP